MAKSNNQQGVEPQEHQNNAEAFINNNQKLFITAIAVIIIVIGAGVAYNNLYRIPRTNKANNALFQGQTYFEQQQWSKALQGDSIAYQGFLSIADNYSGTDAANLAHAYAGICYKQLGENDKAIQEFNQFNASDDLASAAVISSAATCYADAGQPEKAASMLIDVAKKADANSLSPIFLKQAGEIYVSAKKFDKAVAAFQMIKDKYAATYVGMNIDKYIEQAKLQK